MTDVIQRSFGVGEVAPDYWIRNDLEAFGRSVRSCKNFIPTAAGSLINRSGLKYIAELSAAPDIFRKAYLPGSVVALRSAATTLYVDYLASSSSSLVSYTSVYGSNNAVKDYTNADIPVTAAIPTKEYGGIVAYSGVTYTGSPFTLTQLRLSSSTAIPLAESNSSFGSSFVLTVAIPGAGTIPVYYEVTMVDANGVESLSKTGIVSDTGDALTAANPATLTFNEPAYGTTVPVKYYVYRVEAGVSRFIGDITATGGGAAKTFIDYAFTRDLNLAPPKTVDVTEYPYHYGSSVTVHQQRLIVARTNTITVSRVGVTNSFYYNTPISDSDAFSAKANSIYQIYYVRSVGDELFIFEPNGIWVCRGDATGALTPTGSGMSLRWTEPVMDVAPEVYKSGAIYCTSNYNIRYLERNPSGGQGYVPRNLSELTYKLTRYLSVTSLSTTSDYHEIVWSHVKNSLTGNYDQERSWRSCTLGSDVPGWAHHVTDGEVLMSCDGYFIVKRTINSVDKYYLEQLSTREDNRTFGVFLDCYKTYASPGLTINTLSHLEGKSVYAMVDGYKQGPFTVTGGAITLTETGTVVHVGLAYDSEVTTHDVDLVGQQTLVRQVKVASAVNVWFISTAGGEVRVNSDPWQEIRLRDESDNYDPIELRSGLTEDIHVSTSPRRECTISVRQTEPLPMTIIGLARSVKGS